MQPAVLTSTGVVLLALLLLAVVAASACLAPAALRAFRRVDQGRWNRFSPWGGVSRREGFDAVTAAGKVLVDAPCVVAQTNPNAKPPNSPPPMDLYDRLKLHPTVQNACYVTGNGGGLLRADGDCAANFGADGASPGWEEVDGITRCVVRFDPMTVDMSVYDETLQARVVAGPLAAVRQQLQQAVARADDLAAQLLAAQARSQALADGDTSQVADLKAALAAAQAQVASAQAQVGQAQAQSQATSSPLATSSPQATTSPAQATTSQAQQAQATTSQAPPSAWYIQPDTSPASCLGYDAAQNRLKLTSPGAPDALVLDASGIIDTAASGPLWASNGKCVAGASGRAGLLRSTWAYDPSSRALSVTGDNTGAYLPGTMGACLQWPPSNPDTGAGILSMCATAGGQPNVPQQSFAVTPTTAAASATTATTAQMTTTQMTTPTTTTPTPAAPAATLYKDAGFAGTSTQLAAAGDYDLPQLQALGYTNDTASSAQVRSDCTLTIYKDEGFGGAVLDLTGDVSQVPSGWNDQASSARVSCGAPAATLYKDAGFAGTATPLPAVGDYDLPRLQALGYANDTASSVQVRQGCTLTLYKDAGFGGGSLDLTGGVSQVPAGWNDQASSARVRCSS
jgi:hypothetical protein